MKEILNHRIQAPRNLPPLRPSILAEKNRRVFDKSIRPRLMSLAVFRLPQKARQKSRSHPRRTAPPPANRYPKSNPRYSKRANQRRTAHDRRPRRPEHILQRNEPIVCPAPRTCDCFLARENGQRSFSAICSSHPRSLSFTPKLAPWAPFLLALLRSHSLFLRGAAKPPPLISAKRCTPPLNTNHRTRIDLGIP